MNPEIARAVGILHRGGLVAFPTETVYGLGADASNDAAVRRIYTAKGRPADHPLIVHLARRDQLGSWAAEISPAAALLTQAFWPGPLTVLVPKAHSVSDVVTGGRPTVGLRVPAHPVALELLEAFGGGIAAPSANRFGHVSPTTAKHVLDDLGDRVDLVLDGGECRVGVESSIVDCTVDPPQLLRAGGVTAEQLIAVLGSAPAGAVGPSRAAGMLASHYAPDCEIRLVDTAADAERLTNDLVRTGIRARSLTTGGDVTRAAHELYARLRQADEDGVQVLVAELPGPAGLGLALQDRLRKAASPR